MFLNYHGKLKIINVESIGKSSCGFITNLSKEKG